ncbi:hypothetical protein [Bacillus subtilis]|uniref:Uncharacterized protein n=1 Tax=Bacillus subtilis TaxID=1423 RepID=A0AAP1E4U3_BACIU|nr:hypothetical protein [Bacillus subtilis]KIN51147.1 hypothetical protein B4146_0607 [Bacillus subtilis]KZD87332.1 hypothetical protein B4122_4556 [Bacillus subtilis]
MSNEIMQEKDADINELVEEVLFLEDLEMDKDIREWLQTPPIQLKEYGFEEVDREEEYQVLQETMSDYLMER